MENGVFGFAEQPLVIAGANSVRLPKQHKVGHDAKERLSWTLWPTVTWPVSMAARRLSEAKHVSTWGQSFYRSRSDLPPAMCWYCCCCEPF